MKHIHQSRGFTLLEIIIVMAILIILVSVSIAIFNRNRVEDDVTIAQIDLITLALEQYHAQCKVYPLEKTCGTATCLDRESDNAYPARSTPLSCGATLGDFLPSDIDVEKYEYVALTKSQKDVCTGYHLAGRIESDNPKLADDQDFGTGLGSALSSTGWMRCSNGSTSNPGVNFSDDDGKGFGYYDLTRMR